MKPLVRGWRTITGGEEGQIVILTAAAMIAMLGFTALAIDIGFITHERRDLQNGADAMALAGGSQIKEAGAGNAAAEAEARKWASYNGVSDDEITKIEFGVTCSDKAEPNTITVHLLRTRDTFLAGVIGVDAAAVGVCATAGHYSFGGSVGAAPFGVEDDCVYGPDAQPGTGDAGEMQPGSMVTIKYDASTDDGGGCDQNNGNFWTLAIDDTGAGESCGEPEPADSEDRKLKEAICYGAITPLCTQDALDEGETCETTTDTQTGNQVAAIKDSVKYIVDNAPDDCDTLEEVIDDTDGVYSVVDQCNPFLPGYEGVSLVMLIPVLNGLFPDANGKTNIDIVGFLIAVIDPSQVTGGKWCTGNNCDLQAQIVETTANAQALRQALNDDSPNNFTVLVE